jgi:predicted glycoside hydrolase/deacetylase ChbG (UPF0249 family)
MTLLVITADDLGIDPRRDDGILEAFAAGAITQASLLVAGRSSAEAATRARSAGLPLGLHLDLTEMPASAGRDAVPSLLDPHGDKLGKHGLRAAIASGVVKAEHLALEAEAQLAAFAKLVGQAATHVDGHQHVHAVPEIAAAIAPVLAARGVRTIRIPSQAEVRLPNPDTQRFYKSVSDDGVRSRAIFAAAGIGSTTAFAGLDLSGPAFLAGPVRAAVKAHLGAASVELMCHPGHRGTGVDEFNESVDREDELKVLLGLPFAGLLADGGVVLSSFAQVAARGALA